jgi:hypothetical protein
MALLQGLMQPVGRLPGHPVHHSQPPSALVVALDLSQPALGMVGQDSEYPERATLA